MQIDSLYQFDKANKSLVDNEYNSIILI